MGDPADPLGGQHGLDLDHVDLYANHRRAFFTHLHRPSPVIRRQDLRPSASCLPRQKASPGSRTPAGHRLHAFRERWSNAATSYSAEAIVVPPQQAHPHHSTFQGLLGCPALPEDRDLPRVYRSCAWLRKEHQSSDQTHGRFADNVPHFQILIRATWPVGRPRRS